ncbi:nucleotide-binding universal stress UspA family protein [Lewinella marina]|uniref:Uncharacterized protein n=1 Tax=Neolewinella marina TaxID=438751 RepID=A0A2G0CJ19_9BACT|nr:T9SS type A sorting domain-containing protein [Neolewinella marina]NJB84877.1 nucleotide-binding universal stress UspA family protein [Neolewinella marina]PHK99969.1 hypothetical protein CGL56_02675 [Neolewinella marina]
MKYLSPLLLALFLGTCVRAQTYISVERQDSVTTALLALVLPIDARYDVVNYKVRYRTVDVFGQPDTASGLLSIPYDRGLQFPLAAYQHGTATSREAVPSRPGVQERLVVNALATYGYITVAADYSGLGDSDGFHPYVHAESEARAGRDLLLAARQWLEERNIPFNDQLFVAGYSQGGHAAQALHRYLQLNPAEDDLVVTAGAHLSGPYSISDVMREATLSDNPTTFPAFIVTTYLSYDYVYGLFDELNQLITPPYLEAARRFKTEATTLEEFNAELIQLLEERAETVTDVLQDSIREQLLSEDPDSRLLRVMRENDTYAWPPEAPTLLYYCTQDEQVPGRNAVVADSVMTALGSTSVVLESGGARGHGQCFVPALESTLEFFEQFARRDPATSTGQPLELPAFTLSPNPVPAGGNLQLHGLPPTPVHYELYDVGGRTLQRGTLDANRSIQLKGSDRRGLFLLRITLPSGDFVVRKVVVR